MRLLTAVTNILYGSKLTDVATAIKLVRSDVLKSLNLVGEGFELDFELIKEFLGNVETISGRFEQQLVDAEDNVIEKSSGTLDIMRPAKFRWRYSEPYQQILVHVRVQVYEHLFS